VRATSKWRNEEILEHLLLRWTNERGNPVFTKYVPATPRRPDAAAAQARSCNPALSIMYQMARRREGGVVAATSRCI